jgi:hypothetical protein
VTQRRERPPVGDGTDLTRTEGEPTPAADRAYERWRSDVRIESETRLPFGSTVRFLLRAGERSKLITVVTYGIAAMVGLVTALCLRRAVSLGPAWAAAGGGVVWIVITVAVFAQHRLRRPRHRRR